MRATLTFILLTALRDRLFPTLAILLAMVAALAVFAGHATVVEQRETAIVLAAGAARVVVVLGLLVFIAFHIQRLVESRELEVLVSRPISRERLVLALFLGYAVVATLLVAAVGLAVAAAAPHTLGGAAFAGSLLLEAWLVCALTLFAALTLERAVVATLAAGALYVFGRLAALFAALAQSPLKTFAGSAEARSLMDWVIVAITTVMPRLDLFAQTRWLVHGPGGDGLWSLMLAQATIYLPLLLAATMIDLRRKRL